MARGMPDPPAGIEVVYDEITYKATFRTCPGGLLTDENGKPVTIDASARVRQSFYAKEELQKALRRVLHCMEICRKL